MNIGHFLGYGSTVFTPWIRRQTDRAVFTIEVVDNPASLNVSFTLYEKDTDEYGAGSARGDTWSISGGYHYVDAAALKQLVRVRLVVDPPSEEPLGSGIVYRILETTWYDAA